MARVVSHVAVAFAGIVVGVAGALLFAESSELARPAPTAQPSAADRALELRVDAVEKLLARSTAAAPVVVLPSPVASPANVPAAPEASVTSPLAPTGPEGAAIELAQHAALVAAVEHESVDSSWAPHAAKTLRADLDAAAIDAHYAVVSLVCKTTQCLATIEWPSHADALKYYERAIKADLALNCGRALTLTAPPKPGPYRADLVFDCESVRYPE